MTTITCTATTRLTHAECLARLAACPALPRGERPANSNPRPSIRKQWFRMLLASEYINTRNATASDLWVARWRRLAAPLRKAREQRQRWRASARDWGEENVRLRTALRNLVKDAERESKVHGLSPDFHDTLGGAKAALKDP